MEGIEEFKSIANDLLEALDKGNIEYYKVQQGIDNAGELMKPEVDKLNI